MSPRPCAGVNFLTLRAIPASAGMTSRSSEIFERVGDCNRKQNSKEAIATCCTSELCDRETNMLYALVRVGDCNRKQSNREAIATSWGSAMKMHKCIFTALALRTFHVKHFLSTKNSHLSKMYSRIFLKNKGSRPIFRCDCDLVMLNC